MYGIADTACCAKLTAAKFSSNIPVLVLDTDGQALVGRNKTNATLCTCGAGNLPGGDYDGPVSIHYRGGVDTSALVPCSRNVDHRPSRAHSRLLRRSRSHAGALLCVASRASLHPPCCRAWQPICSHPPRKSWLGICCCQLACRSRHVFSPACHHECWIKKSTI